MEITLGMLGPQRRMHARARWPLRRRRAHSRDDAMSVDDLLRLQLLQRLASDEKLAHAQLWPWAGAAPEDAPPPRATPDYVMLDLEGETRVVGPRLEHDLISGDVAEVVLGTLALSAVVMFLLTYLLRCCRKPGDKDDSNEEQILPSPSDFPSSDLPPPYSEMPVDDKTGEEPPPPYYAAYVAYAEPKAGPDLNSNNERDEPADEGGELVINLHIPDHRTSEDAIAPPIHGPIEHSICNGLEVVT